MIIWIHLLSRQPFSHQPVTQKRSLFKTSASLLYFVSNQVLFGHLDGHYIERNCIQLCMYFWHLLDKYWEATLFNVLKIHTDRPGWLKLGKRQGLNV